MGGQAADSVSITGSLYGATVDFGAGDENFTLSVGATNTSIAGGAGNDTFAVTVRTSRQLQRSPVEQVTTQSASVANSPVESLMAELVNDTLELCWCQQQCKCQRRCGFRCHAVWQHGYSSLLYGGAGGDSMRFSAAISASTIDFGADNDSATFSVAMTNNTIQGGSGADTFVFNTLVSSNYIYGGADGDTLVSPQVCVTTPSLKVMLALICWCSPAASLPLLLSTVVITTTH